MSNISGLTEQEQLVMNKIVEAYSEWLKLKMQHTSEIQFFVDAIHTLQSTLAMRVIRRSYPKYWISDIQEKEIDPILKEIAEQEVQKLIDKLKNNPPPLPIPPKNRVEKF